MNNDERCKNLAFKKVVYLINDLYDAGFTQTEIANGINVCDRTIRKWLYGESIIGLDFYFRLLQFCKDNEVLVHKH